MMDDPISHFVFGLFAVIVAAFVIGFLFFQFRLSASWCPAAAEAATIIYFFAAGGSQVDWLMVFHVVALPVFLIPLLAGYYLNKLVIVHEGD